MQPQQTPYAPQPSSPSPEQTPYDFFLNPPPPKRRFSIGGSSMLQRALVVVGGLVVLTLIVVVLRLLLGGGDAAIPNLVSVTQDQQQIVNISTQAATHASNQTTKNLAASATLSAQSAQQNLLAYLQENGRKVSKKELALKQSSTTDTTLKNAIAASNFDVVYLQVMQTQLKTYERDLKIAFDAAGSEGKKLLQQQHQSAKLLLAQTNSVMSASQ